MKNKIIWTVSLVVVAIITIIMVVTSFAGVNLPDWLVRTLGIAELISLFIFVFITVKNAKRK